MEILSILLEKDTNDCDVILCNDKIRKLICYCGNKNFLSKENDIKKVYAFLAKDFIISKEKKYNCQKLEEYYNYRICGKLKQKNIVKFYDIDIELDNKIPDDIKIGEFICFQVSRLDIY